MRPFRCFFLLLPRLILRGDEHTPAVWGLYQASWISQQVFQRRTANSPHFVFFPLKCHGPALRYGQVPKEDYIK